jgi:RHS repeat-associated protein
MVNDSYLMEKDDNGTTTAVYTNNPAPYGRLISQCQIADIRYFHFDAQGSTRQLTDVAQTLTDDLTYSAFGSPVVCLGATATPFRYGGRFGYYNNSEARTITIRARHYAFDSARWLSYDPFRFADGCNYFLFVNNDPISKSDPSGFKACVGTLTITKTPINFDLQVRDAANNQGFIGARLDILAQFEKPCCECCSYRQYISLHQRVVKRGTSFPFTDQEDTFPQLVLNEHGICFAEDESLGQRYGHRDEPDDLGKYAADGCSYEAVDEPGLVGISDTLRMMRPTSQWRSYSMANCMSQIIDTCNHTVVKTERYYVEVLITIDVSDLGTKGVRNILQHEVNIGSGWKYPDADPFRQRRS